MGIAPLVLGLVSTREKYLKKCDWFLKLSYYILKYKDLKNCQAPIKFETNEFVASSADVVAFPENNFRKLIFIMINKIC